MTDVEPSVIRCAPGQRTPKDQIKLRERPTLYSTDARGLSGQQNDVAVAFARAA